MLIGRFENSIDEKNRMIVPAKFREHFGGKCVATMGVEECLVIFPVEKWEEYAEEMDKKDEDKENVRWLQHHFYSGLAECEIDKQGRLTIPKELKNYAKLDKELVTIGQRKKMVVWGKEVLKEKVNSLGKSPAELSESIGK